MKRRVVVTGLGAVTCNGIGKDSFWEAIKSGKSGIKKISSFDPSEFPCQIAGEVVDFKPTEYISKKDLRHMDRFSQFGVVRSIEVVKDMFSGKCKGFAFLEMEGHEARAAIAGLNGKTFEGNTLKVKYEVAKGKGRRR